MYKIKRFVNKIKKVFYWLPYIWKDEDWDYAYIYELLYAKLNRMDNYWENCDDWIKTVTHEKEHRRIKVAKNLAKRLADDNYLNNALFWHRKKYEPYVDFISKKPNKDGFYTYIEDVYIERSKDFSKCYHHSDYMDEQDKELLFKYLKKYSDGWCI